MEKVLRVIKSNENAWLKPYVDMNTDLRKKTRNWLWKSFFKLVNNFGNLKGNLRKHRDIIFVTTEIGGNYLVSEPNYHTTTFSQKIYQQ